MPEAKKPAASKAQKAPQSTTEESKVVVTRGAKTPRGKGKYDATGSYNPKAAKNVESYEEVLAVLPATLEEITAAIPQHTDFVGYLIRRGAIAEA